MVKMAQKNFITIFIFSATRARVLSIALALLATVVSAASDLKSKYETLEKTKAIRTAQSAGSLAQLARNEKDTNFRLTVLDEIASLGFSSVVPQLAPLFRDKNISVRQRAARVVGMLGGPNAEDVLLTAYSHEQDATVKAAIIQGLSLCGSEKSLQTLQTATGDSDPSIRAYSKHAMDRMRRPSPANVDKKRDRKGK